MVLAIRGARQPEPPRQYSAFTHNYDVN